MKIHSHNLLVRKLLLVVQLVLFTLLANSQVILTGVIKDAQTGSTLPGATVVLQGTNYGTITDAYGQYNLPRIPTGKSNIEYSYIGYVKKIVPIEVTDQKTLQINVELDVETIGVDEVVVTSQMLGQTKAINQQLNSDAIVNVVSEDKMKELPDANAAEAIGRISGISLLRNQGEGQKVVIRGMEPRFSLITINGIKVPSNNPSDKSVDLSMISPELLQGIEVYKSPTPDMDGEAVGGTVNLLLNKAPDDSKLKFNMSSGYNFLRKDLKNYNISGMYSHRFLNKKLGIIAQANAERVNRGSDNMSYSYTTNQVGGLDTLSYRSVTQQKVDEIRSRYGASINLDYQLKQGEINMYSLYSNTGRDIVARRNAYGYPENSGRMYIDRTISNTDLFSNMLSGNHTLGILKTDWSLSYAKTTAQKPTNYAFWMNNLSPFGGQKLGTNSTPDVWIENGTLDNDSLTYLYDITSEKTNVAESNMTAALNFEIPLNLGDNWAISFKFGGKYNILDRTRDDIGNWERWYYLGVPGRVTSWDANYPGGYTIDNQNRILLKTFTNENYTSEEFLNNTQFNNPIDVNKVENWYNYFSPKFVDNRGSEVNNVDLQETILAGYFMAKIKYKKVLTIIPGVRLEKSDNQYLSRISSLSGYDNQLGSISDTITYQNYTEVLPHLHIKFEPLPWYSLRFSMAKTLARPNYDYVAYGAYVDNNATEITSGNPGLQHMSTMNYDLNMSFYTGKYGLLSIGGFYKDIQNIFYKVENLYLANDSMATSLGWAGKKGYYLNSYQNSPEAKVFGAEIEVQTNLKFLPKPFNGIVLNANLSRLFSETTKFTNKYIVTDSLISFNPRTGPVFYSYSEYNQRKITIPGQVPLIFNMSVGYEDNGFSIRLSGNYQGQYLISPAENYAGLNDQYRDAFWRWDLAMKQKITNYLEVYINANNLNNMAENTHLKKIYLPIRSVVTGPMISYGVRLNF